MQTRPLHPCAEPGCPALSQGPRCPAHRLVRRQVSPQPSARPSPSLRTYDAEWREIRKQVLEEEPVCQTPGCTALSTEVDHLIPWRMGGTRARENLVARCKPCHSRKTARQDGGFGNTRR